MNHYTKDRITDNTTLGSPKTSMRWIPQVILCVLYVVWALSMCVVFQFFNVWYSIGLSMLPFILMLVSILASRQEAYENVRNLLFMACIAYAVKIVLYLSLSSNTYAPLIILCVLGIGELTIAIYKKVGRISIELSWLHFAITLVLMLVMGLFSGWFYLPLIIGDVVVAGMTLLLFALLAPKRDKEAMEKSKTTTIILSILLGELGIDRFYLGYMGLGIVKLLTAGGFGFWWIVDIVMACTGSLRPADGSAYREELVESRQNDRYAPRPKVTDSLRELQELYSQGIITHEEYQNKRQQVMERL